MLNYAFKNKQTQLWSISKVLLRDFPRFHLRNENRNLKLNGENFRALLKREICLGWQPSFLFNFSSSFECLDQRNLFRVPSICSFFSQRGNGSWEVLCGSLSQPWKIPQTPLPASSVLVSIACLQSEACSYRQPPYLGNSDSLLQQGKWKRCLERRREGAWRKP